MQLYTCDFCKKGPLPCSNTRYSIKAPEGWDTLRVSVTGMTQIQFHCCDECLLRLGVDKEKLKSTPQDDLYGIIQAMVEEAMEP